ncbi:MAG: aspartate aminotransferase family protein, partial [Actinomycetota bacterium]
MHQRDSSVEVLTQAIVRYAMDRVRMEPPLDGPRTEAELTAMAGTTISELGLGGLEALRVFADVLAPACISTDHPRFLSFVPAAPTEASILFDLVVGASSIYGGSWMEGAGAVFAENQA